MKRNADELLLNQGDGFQARLGSQAHSISTDPKRPARPAGGPARGPTRRFYHRRIGNGCDLKSIPNHGLSRLMEEKAERFLTTGNGLKQRTGKTFKPYHRGSINQPLTVRRQPRLTGQGSRSRFDPQELGCGRIQREFLLTDDLDPDRAQPQGLKQCRGAPVGHQQDPEDGIHPNQGIVFEKIVGRDP